LFHPCNKDFLASKSAFKCNLYRYAEALVRARLLSGKQAQEACGEYDGHLREN
jgi:hypothetical protein